VLMTFAGLFAILALWLPDPLYLAVLSAQVLILGWTHRSDLRQRPRLRPRVARLFSR